MSASKASTTPRSSLLVRKLTQEMISREDSLASVAVFAIDSMALLDSPDDRLTFATRARRSLQVAAARPGLKREQAKAGLNRRLESMLEAGADPMVIAAAAMEDMDVRDRASDPEESIPDSLPRASTYIGTPLPDLARKDKPHQVTPHAPEPGLDDTTPDATQHLKVIAVLDCEVAPDFGLDGLFENAPSFIEYAICGDATGKNPPYRFSNVAFYTDIKDLDLDRAQSLDHFAPAQSALWIDDPRPAPEEPAIP